MFKKSHIEDEFCPLLRQRCIVGRCKFWTRIQGKNPQTMENVDQFDCAISWLPILLIENAQMMKQTGAATESMRNEIVKRMDSPKIIAQGSGNGRQAIPRV